mgnify:FL=1
MLPAIAVALAGGTSEIVGLKPPGEISLIGVVDLTARGVVDDAQIAWHNADQEAADAEERQLPGSEEVLGDKLPEFLKDKQLTDRRDYGGFDEHWRIALQRYADVDVAREAVRSGEASAVYVLDADWMETAHVTALLPERGAMSRALYPGKVAVARMVRKSLAARFVTDDAVLERLVRVMETTDETVVATEGEDAEDDGPNGLDEGIAMILPVLFASFFSLSIFVASGYLLDGIGEEKENRVLEVLLASLTPEELLLGKMIGLGGAGLLQTSVLLVLGLIPMLAMGALSLGVATIAGMALCAALGYAEYASVMAASGAVAGNRQEGRQISAVFTLTASSPMFVLPVFLAAPDGAVSVFLSLFPPTAPMAMTMRLGLGDVPLWHVAVAVVGMAAAAWLSWRVGSRVFRVGILMTGARPPLRQIWAWIRTA